MIPILASFMALSSAVVILLPFFTFKVCEFEAVIGSTTAKEISGCEKALAVKVTLLIIKVMLKTVMHRMHKCCM